VSKKKVALTRDLGRAPTTQEIAQALGQPIDEIEHIERMSRRTVSLDAPIGEEGGGKIEDLVRDAEPLPGSGLGAALKAREDLASVLRDLPDTERHVLELRFGLSGEEPRTLESIGRQLGITRERVRQIEAASLARLRRLMAARGMEATDLF
jgi:RNA polymerase primary sigma factor